MKPSFAFILLLMSCQSAFSQKQNEHSFILGAQYGAYTVRKNSILLSDWNKLAPDVPNPQDTSFHYNSQGGNSYIATFFDISGLSSLGMKPIANGRLQPLAGVTIGIGVGSSANASWQRTTETPYDTLTSSNTGEQYYLDSVSTEYLSKNYQSSNVLIGLKFLLQTTSHKRWTMSIGLAAKYGFSYNSFVTTYSGTSYYLEQISYDNYLVTYSSGNSAATTRSAPRGTQLWISVPAEISYRLGNKRFWQSASVGIEASVGSRTSMIAGYSSITSLAYSAAIGLKYRFLTPHTIAHIEN